MTTLHCPALAPHVAEAILNASKLASQSLDPLEAINNILKLISDDLGLHQPRVVLPDKSGRLRIRYAYGLSHRQKQLGVYAPDEGITSRVMRSGEAALIRNANNDPAFVGKTMASAQRESPTLAYVAAPILRDNAPSGVLAALRDSPSNEDVNSDLYIIQIMAAMIGLSLQIQQLTQSHTEAPGRPPKPHVDDDNTAVHGILGNSPALRESIAKAKKAATSTATAMLVGESGSGKERFARMIHLASPRCDKPFVCLNCAAIPPELLESELFGHEKGSFTGATQSRSGKFEIADGGTLFLDEIGDMSLDLQSKLLRVVQEKAVQRIGSGWEKAVDVRIITATNKNLEDAVNEGTFRLDLFYRLNVIRITLPPLRERIGDIELLSLYFLSRCNQLYRRNVTLTQQALAALTRYAWPGNVRQLENVIERLVIMSDHNIADIGVIESVLSEEAAIAVYAQQSGPSLATQESGDDIRPYSKVCDDERSTILDALTRSKGNKTCAARLLGLTPRQLHYRLNKLSIRA